MANGNGHKKYKRGNGKHKTPEKSEEERKRQNVRNVAGKSRGGPGHTKSKLAAAVLGKQRIGGPGTPTPGPRAAGAGPKFKDQTIYRMKQSAVQKTDASGNTKTTTSPRTQTTHTRKKRVYK